MVTRDMAYWVWFNFGIVLHDFSNLLDDYGYESGQILEDILIQFPGWQISNQNPINKYTNLRNIISINLSGTLCTKL